jgi:glycosyltransferase involved in cell wall biosynthesis
LAPTPALGGGLNIVQLVNTLEVGGAEHLVVNLAHSLRARGHSVSVVCLRQTGALMQSLVEAGIRVWQLDKPEGPSLQAVRDLARHLAAVRADVIHSHNPLVHHYAVAAARLAGVRVVVNTIHGIANIASHPGPKEALYGLACRLSDAVVAVCPMAFRAFSSGRVVPRRKLVVINNGIPLQHFLRVPERRAGIETVFGVVGRLVPIKDHQTLLQAFALLLTRAPGCRLEILGDGPLRTQLQSQAHELQIDSRVRFHGARTNVADFLASIDVAVLSSVSEALPLSLLESMAAGRPVVSTAVGGVPDLLSPAHCGWLCPPSRPDLLAESLLAAHQTEPVMRARMGARARQFALQNHSLDRMADEYVALYRRLRSARVPVV